MLLGLDLGTGSCKVLLLSEEGTVVGQAARSYAVLAPQPGWSESNPLEWWQAIGAAVKEAIGNHAPEVTGIGLSGQMHGLVLCNAAGQAMHNAILWSDARSSGVLEQFRQLEAGQFRPLGNPIVTGMLGASLLWYKIHSSLAGVRWALLPKDWLRFCLTQTFASEPSDASATLLYNLEQDSWALDVLESLGLPNLLPKIQTSSSLAGTLTREAAQHLGLQAGIPVAMGGGDTPCAMLGNGIIETGIAQLSVGTGAQVIAPSNTPRFQSSTHCYRTVLESQARYYAMSAMQNAGLALERVRGWLGLTWTEFHDVAFEVSSSADLIFLPYLSGERTPHLNPYARGAFLNLGLQHTQAHLARAALEGVAFSIADGLDALQKTGLEIPALQLVGGGTLDSRWQQLLCDSLETPLYSSGTSNASARGAALLAGLAVGTYQNALETMQMLPKAKLIAEPSHHLEMIREAKSKFRAAYTRA